MKTFKEYGLNENRVNIKADGATYKFSVGVLSHGLTFISIDPIDDSQGILADAILNKLEKKFKMPWKIDHKYQGAGLAVTPDFYQIKKII